MFNLKDVRLRRAVIADSGTIAALELRSAAFERRLEPLTIGLDDFTRLWRQRLTTGSHQTLLAVYKFKTVCGFISLARPLRGGEIQTLYIEPAFMRRGIGTLLLGQTQNLVLTAGGSAMRVEAELMNTSGLRFYINSGFEFDKLNAKDLKVFLKKDISDA